MRKDVKLAFAVGAILISVLIVYVLVVPGDKPRDKQAVTLDTQEKPQSAASQAPTPASSDKPADVAKTPESTSDTKVADATPTTRPTDPFASASDSKEDAWMLALNRGTVPMMTSAPPPPAPQMKNAKAQAATPPALQAVTQAPTESLAPSTRPATLDPAPVSGMRTHKVAKGETIAKIAEAAYGSQNYWPHIIRANPGLVAEKLRPGMTINLPPESEVKGTNATNTTTVADATAPRPDTTSPQLDKNTQYEVQSGDSLAKIAMKLYGNSNKWQAIYDLNKETIGENPAKLKQKSILKLPEPPTVK